MMTTHPIFIDNIAFAKKNEQLAGELPLADCARLSELLKRSHEKANAKDSIRYQLQGETDAAGQHLLHLSLTAHLTGTCQRCLNDMPLTLTLNFNYLIADVSDTDADAVDSDDFDLQPASQNMDIIALVEDELIMAMPIAPTHDNDCGAASMQSGEKPNPFAALKNLIKT